MKTLNVAELTYISGGKFEVDIPSVSKFAFITSTGVFKLLWDTTEHSLQGSITGIILSATVGMVTEKLAVQLSHYINS